MKTSLYEEIVAAIREGNSKEDITSLINEAAAQVKEENNATKISLTEARANYNQAALAYYQALGVEVTEEEVKRITNATEKALYIALLLGKKYEEDNDDEDSEYDEEEMEDLWNDIYNTKGYLN